MRKQVTPEEFNNLTIANDSDYKQQATAAAFEALKEIQVFYPTTSLLFEVTEEDGKIYYEGNYTLYLQVNPFPIVISKNTYRKKYNIFARYHDLKYTTNQTAIDIKNKMIAPNEIGVLTTKKIQQWIDYHTAVRVQMEAINTENGSKIEAFLESIKDEKVRWWNDNKNGEILKNGILMKFTINDTYVSIKLEVHYSVSDNYENFLKLSKNEYNGKA